LQVRLAKGLVILDPLKLSKDYVCGFNKAMRSILPW